MAVATVATISAVGCNTIKNFTTDRKVDYRSAETLPPLRIPPELARGSQTGTGLKLPVPPADHQVVYGRGAQSAAATARPVSPSAPVHQWLIVSGEPAKRWEEVREFLKESGLEVLVADAETGILETGWVGAEDSLSSDFEGLLATHGFRGNGEFRDKFEARVSVGDRPGTTAIQVTHRALAQVTRPDDENANARSWEPRASDGDLEAGVLGLVAQHLGVQPSLARRVDPPSATTPVAVDTGERVTLRRSSDGVPALTIRDDYDQAWQRVGESLDHLGMT
ncbi:MAG: outer membrane protein assembly factor BamC, partial [Gammaproteobacteria bacterium]|nr:outer membrane protein assembly factor BamC [Gammaproteobacteria bacterium]